MWTTIIDGAVGPCLLFTDNFVDMFFQNAVKSEVEKVIALFSNKR
jgi:hypothetical protein